MKLKLGDRVRFVNENLEGIITAISDKKTVGVTIDGDFEIPVLPNELVRIDFDAARPDSIKSNEEKLKPTTSNQPVGIFAAFERSTETSVRLHLHNNFCDLLTYSIHHKKGDSYQLLAEGKLPRDENTELGSFSLSNIEDWNEMTVGILPIDKIAGKLQTPFQRKLKLSVKEFHRSLKFCFFLNTQAYVFRLDQELQLPNIDKLLQKDFSEKPKPAAPDLSQKPEAVIDLHIEKLIEKGWAKAGEDMVECQMNLFSRSLESAHVHNMKAIIYIHGVGNHYLKNKIRTYLSKHKELVKAYTDADPLKFGGGATFVELK